MFSMWTYEQKDLFAIWNSAIWGRGTAEVEKHGKRRSGEHKGWSSTPASTRDKTLKATRENQRRGWCHCQQCQSCFCFLLPAVPASASGWPLIQPLFPKTCAGERLHCRSPGSLSCTALSPWSIIEVIMPHSIKTRGCKHNCLYFLELQGIIHTKQWWFFR